MSEPGERGAAKSVLFFVERMRCRVPKLGTSLIETQGA